MRWIEILLIEDKGSWLNEWFCFKDDENTRLVFNIGFAKND